MSMLCPAVTMPRDIEDGPSNASPCPVPRAACLHDRTADVCHQAITHAHRIRFHVKPQALQLLVMERRREEDADGDIRSTVLRNVT